MNTEKKSNNDKWDNMHSSRGRVFSGILLVLSGIVLLLKQLGVNFPDWLFTWEMLIIIIGLYIGVKHNFKHTGWLVLISIGGILLIDDIYPETRLENFLWPAVVILIGIVMISTAGKRKERWKEWKMRCKASSVEASSENMLDAVSIMGAIKKQIITKDFKGGEITCIFGGAELNLSQADIEGRVILEVTQMFGGTLLIVPANWEIQSENVAILGGIEDKRVNNALPKSENKILVLKGVTIFGGIDIKSH
ncbi:MAG: cell wall-active antibiotics response protein [Bacteroidia bacterium]|jgi:predicted membrane protein|nr:cell wall-active antibiotics response protein [Bacteroidia bacterium]